MSDKLSLLFDLQKIDSSIDLHRRNIAGLDDGTQARATLENASAELQARQKTLVDDEAALKDKELQLNGAEQEREQKRKRAQSASSNPKEVAALDRKIDELTRLKGKLEEASLMLMDQVELDRARVAEAQKAVDVATKRAADTESTYATARKRLKGELQELLKQREELAPQVDAALLAQYETIRERSGGLGIVEIKAGTCGGCQTAVPTSSLAAARDGKSIVKCESCRRLLFVPH
jgi:uncharacterized protein